MKPIPRPAQITDRLGSTLFVAALVHGVVILGVTFTAGSLTGDHPLPPLSVTLVVGDRDDAEPADRADFLANVSRRGGGEVAHGERPTTALAARTPPQLGDPNGTALTVGTPHDAPPNEARITSRGSSDEQVPARATPDVDPTTMPEKPALSLDRATQQTLASEIDLRAELPAIGDRTLVATPSTRRSDLAEYLEGWRRRVERIGTANYPAAYLGRLSVGRPTLEVAIDRDGDIQGIVVRHSSGDKALDQAALKILRLAAPFEPLPPKIRERYDTLRFAYEWDFFNGAHADRAEPSR